MFADARARRFQVLLIWSLDRMSRQGPAAVLDIVDRLSHLGVTLVSIQEPWIEVGGEMRDLLLSIVGWVARWESQRRSERTRAGLQRARLSGARIGRPRAEHRPGWKSRFETLLKRHRRGEIGIREMARQLDVGAATIYRYCPDLRRSETEGSSSATNTPS